MTWEVGQTVEVQSRTWAGINKPGGCAKITKVHYENGSTVEGLDVKYVVGGGFEKNIDPAIVSPFETLQRGGRKRRGRQFLLNPVVEDKKKTKKATTKTKPLSPQPTSPSTPTTPPEPDSKQQKATKVTPIPSYVSTSGILDVSPLELANDITENKKKKKKPVARRGLFEPVDASPRPSRPRQQQQQRNAVAAALRFGQQRRRSQPPLPMNSDNIVPMRTVFEKDFQYARRFIDTIRGPRSDDVVNADKREQQQEGEELSSLLETPKAPSRFEEFLSIFGVIRSRMDDGEIEEAEFERLFNAHCNKSDNTKPYPKEELNAHLETLSGQGKLMRTEGTIYIIE
eukprot:scaffold5653_cov147-Cylindrotheca_fusiformis.AAC.19